MTRTNQISCQDSEYVTWLEPRDLAVDQSINMRLLLVLAFLEAVGAFQLHPTSFSRVTRILGHPEHENPDKLNIGDRVKVVAEGIKLTHLPKFKGGFHPTGLEGEIKAFLFKSKDGVEVSVNRPVLVSFADPKFNAHFEFNEIIRA